MSGIYIHIPYCRQACHYCNFHFTTSGRNMEAMYHAQRKELFDRKNYLKSTTVDTIYFGGGTPSLIPADHIHGLIDTITENFDTNLNEVTLEVNPEDVSSTKMKLWKSSGINRISLGVQSFHQSDLNPMNRAHQAEESLTAIKRIQDFGFTNLTIDLIYGLPWARKGDFIKNLAKVVELNIPHLSAYALTVEPKTALAHQIKTKKVSPVNGDLQYEEFKILQDWADHHKFMHYEISNLCQDGYRALHNSNYWNGLPYLGIGPGAHSFNGHSRSSNIPNNNHYIKAITEGDNFSETESLNEKDRFNEAMLISLRTIEGFNKNRIQEFSNQLQEHFHQCLIKAVDNGQIEIHENHVTIPKNRRFLADGIASDFFWIEE